MNILSYSISTHDTSAAIVCDGVLVAAAEEERFSRRKHEWEFPIHAIQFCLQQAGLRIDQVDALALPDKPFRTGRNSYFAEMSEETVVQLHSPNRVRSRARLHKRILDAYLRLGLPFNFDWQLNPTVAASFDTFAEHFGSVPSLRFYDHHRAHAAAAFYTSGWDSAAVLTMDEWGGPYSTVIWHASPNGIKRLKFELRTNSLGNFYSDCTKFLGFQEHEEGKAMGLAAYGNAAACRDRVVQLFESKLQQGYAYRRPPSEQILKFHPRVSGDALQSPYPDFAAAVQAAFECGAQHAAAKAVQLTGTRDLCLGGGVMLNCSSNGALQASKIAANLWIFPASGDAGLAVGAALLCAAERQRLQPSRLPHAYLGPEFTTSDCVHAAESKGCVIRQPADLESTVAKMLDEGKVIGWFQGRMEFGPRALGNRSILADPRCPSMNKRVNQLKGRELWRPFSPVVIADHASEYFELAGSTPFMLLRATVAPSMRRLIPAVVHVDGSARPQTVEQGQNPRLYKLLSAFARRTGIPMLLNTSFNAAREPIECTPEDAVNGFIAMGLDALVLQDVLVTMAAET